MSYRLASVYLLSGLCLFLAGCGQQSENKVNVTDHSDESAGLVTESAVPEDQRLAVLFLGNSLSAGYGISPDEAFPALIQRKVDDAGIPARVVNAGVSGETTAGGLSRVKWLFQQRIDVLVIELGGNDGLRGIPVEATRTNIQGIIDAARSENPNVRIVLCGMKIPPNLGALFTGQFERIFPDLADKNGIDLVPFLLKDVGGMRHLNLPDGIHPTPEGHQIIASTIWATLESVLLELVG